MWLTSHIKQCFFNISSVRICDYFWHFLTPVLWSMNRLCSALLSCHDIISYKCVFIECENVCLAWVCKYLSLLGQCVRVSSPAYSLCTSNGWLGSENIHINLIINNLSNFSKCGLPCRTVPAGQKHPSTQERVPHWEWGLRWTVGHEEEQAGPQGSYTIPLSHCRAAGNEGNNTSIIKRPVQKKWSYRKMGVRCERVCALCDIRQSSWDLQRM